MLRSMTELPQERTMQFVVERACPIFSDIKFAEPFTVWVRIPPEKPGASRCRKPRYRLAGDSNAILQAHGLYQSSPQPNVCGHMGHLVE